MIEKIIIRNFKAFDNSENHVFDLTKNSLIIGENNSGKSSILEALDVFFNGSSVDKILIPDLTAETTIGIKVDGIVYLKQYKKGTGKLEKEPNDIGNIHHLSYIYISPKHIDVAAKVKEFAVAKLKETLLPQTLNDFKLSAQKAIDDVISSVDTTLLTIDAGINNLSGKEKFELSTTTVKYDITYNGLDLNAQGTGSQKTFMYALLTKGIYNNVILGIDEIENSLSINSTDNLISVIKSKFSQTIFTTHSTNVARSFNLEEVLPLFRGTTTNSIAGLYKHLGNVKNTTKPFILVEGKTDVKWFNRALDVLGRRKDFHVIFGGGSSTPDLQKNLVHYGFIVLSIGDGDQKVGSSDYYLSKDTIELYAQQTYLVARYGSSFNGQLSNKADLSNAVTGVGRTIKGLKVELSDDIENIIVDNFHEFVIELQSILSIHKF